MGFEVVIPSTCNSCPSTTQSRGSGYIRMILLTNADIEGRYIDTIVKNRGYKSSTFSTENGVEMRHFESLYL